MDYGHLPKAGGLAIFGLALGDIGLLLLASAVTIFLVLALRRYFRRNKSVGDV
jgi:uncharacterized membrane protein YbaN (DUF454 family)